jgi:hypothetical protein
LKKYVRFLPGAVRDAEMPPWEQGHPKRRERKVHTVTGEHLQEVWNKFGWNDVNSSFRTI